MYNVMTSCLEILFPRNVARDNRYGGKLRRRAPSSDVICTSQRPATQTQSFYANVMDAEGNIEQSSTTESVGAIIRSKSSPATPGRPGVDDASQGPARAQRLSLTSTGIGAVPPAAGRAWCGPAKVLTDVMSPGKAGDAALALSNNNVTSPRSVVEMEFQNITCSVTTFCLNRMRLGSGLSGRRWRLRLPVRILSVQGSARRADGRSAPYCAVVPRLPAAFLIRIERFTKSPRGPNAITAAGTKGLTSSPRRGSNCLVKT
ncbi:hypothetical protein EVAR_57944_1 [Eumeta japonica]|uniref:Uncharacterized protein n=1 Tax=Eumeta variegata TaxID=151549 RepID=A0A4C1ZLX0_EUMVA|nr:hypothetical protein EVAR_57944_1 [Eumeta japonica]